MRISDWSFRRVLFRSAPTTKGRPREFCVDKALVDALHIFWAKGYDGASMTDLTEAMGITKPSLYAAFGNKEALFHKADRKSVVEGKSVSVRVDLGGRRIIQQRKTERKQVKDRTN